MNNNIFKKLKNNCYINIKQFNIYDITIPSHCVIYNDTQDNTLYICTHFPNYAGKPENINLHVVWYDYKFHTVGDAYIKNCEISIALFNAWKNASKPRSRKIRREITMHDYEKMMEHTRKKKSATGGVRLSSRINEITTDNLRYKQNSIYAYHSQYLRTYEQVLD